MAYSIDRTAAPLAILALLAVGTTGCFTPQDLETLLHDEQPTVQNEQPAADDQPIDVEAPRLIETSPAHEEMDMGLAAVIVASFNEPVSGASAAGMSLVGPEGPVAGSIVVDGQDLVFEPEVMLLPASSYLVSLTTQVQDEAGNRLPSQINWTFQTETEVGARDVAVHAYLSEGEWQHFGPLWGSNLRAVLSGTDDADLYVGSGYVPNEESYDCRPYEGNSEESCELDGVGPFFVAVHGYTAASVTLTTEWIGELGSETTGIVGPGEWDRLEVTVRAGHTYRVTTGSETDLDLYVQMDAAPSLESFDGASTSPEGAEHYEFVADADGVLHIGAYGYTYAVYGLLVEEL